MKRHRIFAFDFDTRAHTLAPIPDEWEEPVKQQHRQNQARTIDGLREQFGAADFEEKFQNFRDLGAKPLSIVAFHNRFYEQSRRAFVQCQYYPALTGITALGERVLNHLVLGLRDYYKGSEIYKRIYRKDSFDNWELAIDALNEWNVLTPETDAHFRTLLKLRNEAVHFNPGTEENDRALALEALAVFGRIVESQFAALGQVPWLFVPPGEIYIRKEWEQSPFIQLVYLPSTMKVGYRHKVISAFPWKVEDVDNYEADEVSDEEFAALRKDHQNAG